MGCSFDCGRGDVVWKTKELYLAKDLSDSGYFYLSNGRSWLPTQPVDATHALNRSAGVSYSNVFLGRSFNRRATAFNLTWSQPGHTNTLGLPLSIPENSLVFSIADNIKSREKACYRPGADI